jgi:hypothetical protein
VPSVECKTRLLVRMRTTPTETAGAGEVNANVRRYKGMGWSVQLVSTFVNLSFLDRSRYYFFQVAPHLSSRGRLDPVPEPLLLRKSGSAGNRTRDLWVYSLKLWPHICDIPHFHLDGCIKPILGLRES